jgi:hypothetical protein
MRSRSQGHNEAPAPNRRPLSPLGGFENLSIVFALNLLPPAAVGEAQRWTTTKHDGN